MLEETLVLALGEFGRTPKISTLSGQTTPGRDHWANAMSVLMAGGGTPGGVVVGATDRKGYSAIENVKSPENFVATVYSKLGIDPGKILYTPQGRPTLISVNSYAGVDGLKLVVLLRLKLIHSLEVCYV